jgi:glucose-6-phosphate isomerase
MAIDTSPEWAAVAALAEGQRGIHLRDLFRDDPGRVARLTFEVGPLTADLSKQRITAEALEALRDLARAAGIEERRDAMFRGEPINTTEHRAVLHVALRAPESARIEVDDRDVVPEVHEVLGRMSAFADAVRSGVWTGATGGAIRNIVNIGIGGSDLGPAMATVALRSFASRDMTFRFVSNVDGDDIGEATLDLDPAETLVIVSSKTFTTLETMTNAATARRWITGRLGEDATSRHFVAASTNTEAVRDFGIDPANMFEFWDWVGGRYSMDSAIGLSLMIAIGPEAFTEMLAGFRAVDEHFASTPMAENLPITMGLLRVWERTFLGSPSHAVVPYCHELERFPAYLQQLEMESNGKRVRLDGTPVAYETGPIVWGTPGTNGQHAYFQLIHQGTTVVPVDLIAFLEPVHDVGNHHDLLLANVVAQAEALAFGKTAGEVAAEGVGTDLVPHRTFPGNRPTTVMLLDRLSPYTLGMLVALYEHSVFVQGAVWGIDSFDQWGVELGKKLAGTVAGEIMADTSPALHHDPSTNALIGRIRTARDRPA